MKGSSCSFIQYKAVIKGCSHRQVRITNLGIHPVYFMLNGGGWAPKTLLILTRGWALPSPLHGTPEWKRIFIALHIFIMHIDAFCTLISNTPAHTYKPCSSIPVFTLRSIKYAYLSTVSMMATEERKCQNTPSVGLPWLVSFLKYCNIMML